MQLLLTFTVILVRLALLIIALPAVVLADLSGLVLRGVKYISDSINSEH